jgi:cell division protein FtsL
MGIAKCKARIEQEKKQIEKFEKCLLENQEYLKTIELAESKGLGEFDIERFNKPKGKKTKKYEVGE